MMRRRHLRKRYGRSASHMAVTPYRGFGLRLSFTSLPYHGGRTHLRHGGEFEVDILKRGMIEQTVKAPERDEAILKAKRVVDAMKGD